MPQREMLDPDRGYNPQPCNRLWRDVLLPRLIIPLFWLCWLFLLPFRLVGGRALGRRRRSEVRVAFESGRVGWTQVFFEEMFTSLQEYLGDQTVVQQVIDRDLPYLPQFRANQRRDDASHVVLDVRTPHQSWRRGAWQAVAVAGLLLAAGRTPIVIMPDAFYRRLRWHAACLTAHTGVVLTFAPSTIVAPIFPHRRIVGPLPMPVSRARQDWLELVRSERVPSGDVVQFVGHWYPPRSYFLEDLSARLASEGIELRVYSGKDASNEEYWRLLAHADVVVTTCMQGPDRPFMDWIWVEQLVLRYNETLAAGAALVAARVEGSTRFFTPGVDFLEYVSVDDALDAVRTLVRDPAGRMRISESGHRVSRSLSQTHAFWMIADTALPRDPMSWDRRSATDRIES